MTTNKDKNSKAARHGNRVVHDRQGTAYELTGKLAEGGQGFVWQTQVKNVLVKIGRHPVEDPRTKAWFDHVQWVSRLPLDALKIARPQTLIVHTEWGYVMELMDGLVPLTGLLEESFAAMRDGRGLQGYIDSGGLAKRLRLLEGLCSTLAKLHGRGLAYGDLSPANIFVSRSKEHAEVWLIDCDNISLLSREGGQKIYSDGYGAPEILRGESGINSLTDSWSVGVIAFELLVLLHPLKGDFVNDGEPDIETSALMGGAPWVDDLDDDLNRSSTGLPRELVLTKELQGLFQRCFGAGRIDAGARPTLAEWRAGFEAAAAMLMTCGDGDGCGSSFYYNRARECPFCDRIQDENTHLLMSHYVYAPLSDLEKAEFGDQSPWISTKQRMICGKETVELRDSPVGSVLYAESAPVCSLTLNEVGLHIEPAPGRQVALQSQRTKDVHILDRKKRLNAAIRRGDYYMLHLSDSDGMHDAWRFKW
jgi:DNA-binding helix-hairpin-helix protein with protein kinase domain